MSWMDFIDGQKKNQPKVAQIVPQATGPMRSSPTQMPVNRNPRSNNPVTVTPTRPKNNLERTFFMEWLKKNKPSIFNLVQQNPGVEVSGTSPELQNAFKEFSAESKNLSTNPATGIQTPGVITDAQFESEKFMNLLKQRNPSVWSRVIDDPVSLRKKLQEFKAGKPIEQLAATDEEIKLAGINWFDIYK